MRRRGRTSPPYPSQSLPPAERQPLRSAEQPNGSVSDRSGVGDALGTVTVG